MRKITAFVMLIITCIAMMGCGSSKQSMKMLVETEWVSLPYYNYDKTEIEDGKDYLRFIRFRDDGSGDYHRSAFDWVKDENVIRYTMKDNGFVCDLELISDGDRVILVRDDNFRMVFVDKNDYDYIVHEKMYTEYGAVYE